MIRCNLHKLMFERGLRVADITRDTGLNRSTLTALSKNTAQKVELLVVEDLCRYLGCTAGELFEYIPEQQTDQSIQTSECWQPNVEGLKWRSHQNSHSDNSGSEGRAKAVNANTEGANATRSNAADKLMTPDSSGWKDRIDLDGNKGVKKQ